MADAKSVAEAGWNAWFRGDIDGVMNSYTDDVELSVPGMPPFKGKDAVRMAWQGLKQALPDEHPLEIRHVGEGDTVVTIWTTEATHRGPMPMPNGEMLPPTGKTVVTKGVTVQAFAGDKIRRQDFYWDNLEFMQQLGLLPEQGAVGAA